MPNVHAAARERRSKGPDTLSCHWQPPHPSALGRWLFGALPMQPPVCQGKRKKQSIGWPTFLMLNHEDKYSCSFYWRDQIIPRICRALSITQKSALFSARERFLQGWALCWQHQTLSWFHYLSKPTLQVTVLKPHSTPAWLHLIPSLLSFLACWGDPTPPRPGLSFAQLWIKVVATQTTPISFSAFGL